MESYAGDILCLWGTGGPQGHLGVVEMTPLVVVFVVVVVVCVGVVVIVVRLFCFCNAFITGARND